MLSNGDSNGEHGAALVSSVDAGRGSALRLGALALVASFLGLSVSACGGPPKQAEVADVDKGTGVDMGGAEESAAPPAASAAGAGEGEQDMRAKCCVECKASAAKDRSGAAKSTIPCTDFTATLPPWCLEHFRGHPAMASQCE
jgi:hypothetical protein